MTSRTGNEHSASPAYEVSQTPRPLPRESVATSRLSAMEATPLSQAMSEGRHSRCYSILRNQTFLILVGAALGILLGIAISNGRVSKDVVSWIALPGDLFLRALKCVVLPLVFVNVVLAVIEMMEVGKAVSIGWKTIALYTFTTLVAAMEGLISVIAFKSMFSRLDVTSGQSSAKIVQLTCPSDPNSYMFEQNGTLSCLSANTAGLNSSFSQFELVDVNKVLVVKDVGPKNDISFSQTVQDGIFRKMVPYNIFVDFSDANFIGVIAFAVAFAVAAQLRPKKERDVSTRKLRVMEIMSELNDIFLVLINAVIYLTAPAVVSLIAGALGQRSNLAKVFSDIGVLMAATMLAMLFHALVVYPSLFYMAVKKNPFSYLKFLVPAQTFAFASASSAATLPVTMRCVADTGEVPSSVANFVLSLGATINMDGGAIYFPVAIVFLAVTSGYESELGIVSYILMVLLATLGSAGAAPVPSASLVLIITAFNTVFDTSGTPETFSYILAIDWLMDRFRTVVNITGDAVVTRVVTAMSDLDVQAENLLQGDEKRGSIASQVLEGRLSRKMTEPQLLQH